MADILHRFMDGDMVIEAAKGSRREVRMQRKQLFIEALFNRALRDSDAAARLLMNYHDGLPPFRGTIFSGDEWEDDFDPAQLSDEDLATLVAISRKARASGNGKIAAGSNGKNGPGKKKGAKDSR